MSSPSEYMRRREAEMPECSIKDCSTPSFSRGWCNKHYQRWYHHGDPLYVTPKREPRPKPPPKPRPPKLTLEEKNQRRRERYRRHRGDPKPRQKRSPEEQREIDRFSASTPEAKQWRREYYQRNREYRSRWARRYRDEKLNKIPKPRQGRFTEAEDKIILREDLSITEICYMLGRAYQSVAGRRCKLSNPDYVPGAYEDRIAEMRLAVLAELKHDPARSNRDIAAAAESSHPFVAKMRRELGIPIQWWKSG